jgi:hypothetical protein
MAKHDVDPVLQQLVRAVNESGQAAVPVTTSVHGTVLTGNLIARSRYFSGIRSDGETAEGLWRIGLGSVDGWVLRAVAAPDAEEDRGPFARCSVLRNRPHTRRRARLHRACPGLTRYAAALSIVSG